MNQQPPATTGRKDQADARRQRLAQALRDNLRRRKEQARAQQQPRAPRPSTSRRPPPG